MSGIRKYFASPESPSIVHESIDLIETNIGYSKNKAKGGTSKKMNRDGMYKTELHKTEEILSSENELQNLKSEETGNTTLPCDNLKQHVKKRSKISKELRNLKNECLAKKNHTENENSELKIVKLKAEEPRETNAFQVMMHARTKSIGTNSPGKERDESEILKDQNKDVLAKRRLKFEAWASEKGGLKRKMTEELIDSQIKLEMNKRAKRLKKLLSDNKNKTPKSKNKVTADLDGEMVGKGVHEGKRKDCSNLSPSLENKAVDKSLKNVQCSIKSDSNSKSSHNNTESEVQVIKSNSKNHDEFLSALNSPMKKSRDLLRYFDKIDLTNETSDDVSIKVHSKIDSVENNTDIKRKSKPKPLTPGPKWKIRIVNSNLDCEVESDADCIDTSPNMQLSKQPKSKTKTCQKHCSPDLKCGDNNTKSPKSFLRGKKLTALFDKADNKTIKTKAEFMKSGITENARLMIERQQNYTEFPLFPSVSHIQQQDTSSFIWNLPKENLDNISFRNDLVDGIFLNFIPNNSSLYIGMFTQCERSHLFNMNIELNNNSYRLPKDISKYKDKLKQIKEHFPEFPVYKTFRILKQKCYSHPDCYIEDELMLNHISNNKIRQNNCTSKYGKAKKNKKLLPQKKISLRKSKLEEFTENFDNNLECTSSLINTLLWTDVFGPRSSDEFVGNTSAIVNLKNWLMQWKEFNVIKRKNSNYDSDCSYNSDADFVGSNSNDSVNFKSLKNTSILLGPIGSGKTSAVYSLANELGYNIIELNASSKRTGKIAFTKLQEATQSHGVQSKEKNLTSVPAKTTEISSIKVQETKYSNGIQLLTTKNSQKKLNDLSASKVLSLILVEDIDIVFDQDDGFISALLQIVQTSKRPIIFTSCNESNINVQRFMNNLVIRFKSANPLIMTTWLQILCLVNNLYVESTAILQLLNINKGDIRKTILQLQFWALSGGNANDKYQSVNSKEQIVEDAKCSSFNSKNMRHYMDNVELCPDESSNLSYIENQNIDKEEACDVIQPKCFSCVCSKQNISACRHLFTLEYLWHHFSIVVCESSSVESIDIEHKVGMDGLHNFSNLMKFVDTASYTDIMLANVEITKEMEIPDRGMQEVNDYLLSSLYLKSKLNPHVYSKQKEDFERLLSDIVQCQDAFSVATNERAQNISNPSGSFGRRTKFSKAFILDYGPALRNICRSEKQRSENNCKRMTLNRFYHYFKTLDVNLSSELLNFACNSLS